MINRILLALFVGFAITLCSFELSLLTLSIVTSNYVDSSLKKYLITYISEAQKRNIELEQKEILMIFGNTSTSEDPEVIGFCQDVGAYNYIVIDKVFFEDSNEEEREMLILHELGHCIGKRDHCDLLQDGFPVSLMHSRMFSDDFYKKNRENLLNELFKRDSRCE